MVAVAITSSAKVLQVFTKGLRSLRLGPLAALADVVIRIPEFVYYGMVKAGLDPRKAAYFRRYPLGFTFHLEKAE